MERKTKVNAENDKQELQITREFDLPVELLFKAYVEPDLLEQWMGTKVIKLECRKHGSWHFQTSDAQGNVVFEAQGVIHEIEPNKSIIRTFEMENAAFPVQLEFLDFESLTDQTSKLSMHIVFRSIEDRNQLLKLPFAYGLNMGHNRLQEVLSKLL